MTAEDFKQYMNLCDSLDGKWLASKIGKVYSVRFSFEKNRTTYIFKMDGEVFTTCLENISNRVEDFVNNKKDTFDTFE